jgi:hypothetical protein
MSAGVRSEAQDYAGGPAAEGVAHHYAAPHVLAESYAGFMHPPPKPAAMETIRAGLAELLIDPGITDRARLRQLEQLSEEIEGFMFDLRSRLPEPRSRRGDPPRI